MKSLLLSEIVSQINGRILRGSGDLLISAVKNFSKREIDDHTLIFHRNRNELSKKHWKSLQSIAIVTDSPELCAELGQTIALVVVDDIEEAYFRFVDYYRGLFTLPVIGVTGTCGKTTTKEMMTQILEEDFKVKRTWMSLNSKHVNLRYLTEIEDHTEVAVFEMPVVYPGYLRVACRYFKPRIRILLNIGVHHLADSETPDAYMKAKIEIVDGMNEEKDILILNRDDENISRLLDVTPYKNIVYFGKSESCQFRADDIQYSNGGMDFTLYHNGQAYSVFVPGYGEHNVYNAMAAIAAVSFVGVEIQTAINRLASFEQVEEHLEFKEGVNGCTIIDDTWNSAPLSMETGLQVLKDVLPEKKAIAILGYMPQLGEGPYVKGQYRKMGEKVVQTAVDELVVVGKQAEMIGFSAIEFGMESSKVYFCETGTEVYEVLQPFFNETTKILLKVTHRVMTEPSFIELKNKLIPTEVESGEE